MPTYGQFCPVAKAAEIFAERWTPLVVRELISGSTTFNDLKRGVPLMSRSLLVKRLRDLEKAGVIERRKRAGRNAQTYHLTRAGEELRSVVMSLGEWGQRWARAIVSRDDNDPQLLMWDVHRNIELERVPNGRTVVQFVFPDVPAVSTRRTWLVIAPPEVDVCYKDPGFEVDLIVTSRLSRLIQTWMGDVDIHEAVRDGSIRLEGAKKLVRDFPTWLRLSPFAGVERPGA